LQPEILNPLNDEWTSVEGCSEVQQNLSTESSFDAKTSENGPSIAVAGFGAEMLKSAAPM
jgi:hypothetical protein